MQNGAFVDKPAVWEQRWKASLEFFNDCREIILEGVRRQWAEEGREVALHLWTLSAYDHKYGLCTLICFSDASYPDQVVINAPVAKSENAYTWVVQHNPHLYFMGEPKVGWVADDFQRNSATLVDKFKIRS